MAIISAGLGNSLHIQCAPESFIVSAKRTSFRKMLTILVCSVQFCSCRSKLMVLAKINVGCRAQKVGILGQNALARMKRLPFNVSLGIPEEPWKSMDTSNYRKLSLQKAQNNWRILPKPYKSRDTR